MKTRQITVITGMQGTGKSTLLRNLADANSKGVRYYGISEKGTCLGRLPFEGAKAYKKRTEEAKSDSVMYIDDFYQSSRGCLKTCERLFEKIGDAHLVVATQNSDLAATLLMLNGKENTFIIRL